MATTFKDLRVWQESMGLVAELYRATSRFPKDEQYGLTNQMRRATVSIACNIAEGKGRRTDRDFVSFLYRARGSLMELQTQILIARELQYLSSEETKILLGKCDVVGRSLAGLINALSESAAAAGH